MPNHCIFTLDVVILDPLDRSRYSTATKEDLVTGLRNQCKPDSPLWLIAHALVSAWLAESEAIEPVPGTTHRYRSRVL